MSYGTNEWSVQSSKEEIRPSSHLGRTNSLHARMSSAMPSDIRRRNTTVNLVSVAISRLFVPASLEVTVPVRSGFSGSIKCQQRYTFKYRRDFESVIRLPKISVGSSDPIHRTCSHSTLRVLTDVPLRTLLMFARRFLARPCLYLECSCCLFGSRWRSSVSGGSVLSSP
jgi:hypothetical protein